MEQRAGGYAAERSGKIERRLGQGQDGIVWLSDRTTAIKVFERQENYLRELRCYQRLQSHSITVLGGFTIPALIAHSDTLMVVEMELVTPPYLLDFGKAYLDQTPDFSAEVWNDWEAERRELFEDRWPQVRALLAGLRVHGIHYLDAKPGNIMFGDEQPSQ